MRSSKRRYFWVYWCLLGLVSMACQLASPAQTSSNSVTTSVSNYLALGDSYTIGESVTEQERWCVQLAQLLRQQQLPIANPDIIARTGWTTAELSAAIAEANNPNRYELVSLLIGVNNQYRGQSLDSYRVELRALLQTALQFANNKASRVVVLSIPDWGVTPFASNTDRGKIAKEIDAFNAVAKQECVTSRVAFVDITPLSRMAQNDLTLMASDQLHFSGKMYRQWAEKALPVVKELLK